MKFSKAAILNLGILGNPTWVGAWYKYKVNIGYFMWSDSIVPSRIKIVTYYLHTHTHTHYITPK